MLLVKILLFAQFLERFDYLFESFSVIFIIILLY